MNKIEEVKKTLEDIFLDYMRKSFQIQQEWNSWGDEGEIRFQKLTQNMEEKISEVYRLFPKSADNPDGYEPKPDESRLLADKDVVPYLEKKYPHMYQGNDDSWCRIREDVLLLSLKSYDTELLLEAQRDLTASIKDAEFREVCANCDSALLKEGQLVEINERKDAEWRAKVEKIVAELDNCFELAPDDDSYLRILIKDTLEYIRTGKRSKERQQERRGGLNEGRPQVWD